MAGSRLHYLHCSCWRILAGEKKIPVLFFSLQSVCYVSFAIQPFSALQQELWGAICVKSGSIVTVVLYL